MACSDRSVRASASGGPMSTPSSAGPNSGCRASSLSRTGCISGRGAACSRRRSPGGSWLASPTIRTRLPSSTSRPSASGSKPRIRDHRPTYGFIGSCACRPTRCSTASTSGNIDPLEQHLTLQRRPVESPAAQRLHTHRATVYSTRTIRSNPETDRGDRTRCQEDADRPSIERCANWCRRICAAGWILRHRWTKRSTSPLRSLDATSCGSRRRRARGVVLSCLHLGIRAPRLAAIGGPRSPSTTIHAS